MSAYDDYNYRHLPLKERMERRIMERRDKEQQYQETWATNAKYFSTWTRNVAKFNDLTTGKSSEESQQAWEAEKRRQEKVKSLEHRRETLKKLLEDENNTYKSELDALDRNYKSVMKHRNVNQDESQKLEILKKHAEQLQQKKEEERKKEAAAKDFLRWKANSPFVRDVDSRYHAQFVRKVWEEQLQEKKERDLLAQQSQAKIDEDVKAYQEKELQRIQSFEEERQIQLQQWKADIRRQREELKLREEIKAQLDRQVDEIENQQSLLEETLEARDRLAQEREKKKSLANFWGKQIRLKLRALINERLQSINDDNQMLQYLKHLEDKRMEEKNSLNNNGSLAARIEAVRAHLEEERNKEFEREKDATFLFDEEAKKYLRQQEIAWEKERTMRENLMQDVIATVRHQIEEKRALNTRQRELLNEERGQILYRIEEIDAKIEAAEKEKQESLRRFKTDLDHQVYEKRKEKEQELLSSMDSLSRLKLAEDEQKNSENGMEKFYENRSYVPKFYGHRKVAW